MHPLRNFSKRNAVFHRRALIEVTFISFKKVVELVGKFDTLKKIKLTKNIIIITEQLDQLENYNNKITIIEQR